MKRFREWLIKEEVSIRGEYWIDDSGFPIYADSDIGDWSHEGVVEDMSQREVAEDLGVYADDEFIDWEETKMKIVKENIDSLTPEERTSVADNYQSAFELIAKKENIDNDLLAVAEGLADARDYAMKNWGWKAVRGNYVDTWTLNQNDFKNIYQGLGEIMEGEGIEEEEGDQIKFIIYNHSTGQSKEYTYPEIEQAAQGKVVASPQTGLKTTPADWAKAAAQSTKQADISKLHPYYQKRTFPIGDWNKNV